VTEKTPARRRPAFSIGEHAIAAGRQTALELPIARLISGGRLNLPVLVVHGRFDGPTVWVSSTIHGDEICGVEIIRRVLEHVEPRVLHGTLIALPVVNVHGFNTRDRYLPDRRDLNRAFPGSARGSMASQIAHLMMTEIVQRCSIGIDLHTGADHRTNFPHIRGNLRDPKVLELAEIFAAPLSLHAKVRDGSLRAAATDAGATVLLFEGGEPDRFDEHAIEVGTEGVLRVLASVGMIAGPDSPPRETQLAWSSTWMRATRSGITRLEVSLGAEVEKGDQLATVRDAFGKRLGVVTARRAGVVIGHTQHPLVNRGDAVAHIASLE
jgi:predicted deacylase